MSGPLGFSLFILVDNATLPIHPPPSPILRPSVYDLQTIRREYNAMKELSMIEVSSSEKCIRNFS